MFNCSCLITYPSVVVWLHIHLFSLLIHLISRVIFKDSWLKSESLQWRPNLYSERRAVILHFGMLEKSMGVSTVVQHVQLLFETLASNIKLPVWALTSMKSTPLLMCLGGQQRMAQVLGSLSSMLGLDGIPTSWISMTQTQCLWLFGEWASKWKTGTLRFWGVCVSVALTFKWMNKFFKKLWSVM